MTLAPEPIIRIAAKGDGITATGRFAWGTAPGDDGSKAVWFVYRGLPASWESRTSSR